MQKNFSWETSIESRLAHRFKDYRQIKRMNIFWKNRGVRGRTESSRLIEFGAWIFEARDAPRERQMLGICMELENGQRGVCQGPFRVCMEPLALKLRSVWTLGDVLLQVAPMHVIRQCLFVFLLIIISHVTITELPYSCFAYIFDS